METNKGLVLVKVLRTRCWYAYPSCTLCYRKLRKLHEEDDRLWCFTCSRFYSEENVKYRYHVNLTVTDYSGIASVTVFGKSLETFFGLSATEFCRYVIKCGRKNSMQGFDIHKVVHLAMERCLVGKMVYLTFRLTNHAKCKSISHDLKGNLLPDSKVKNPNSSSKMPELLANVICKVQHEEKERSIANILTEYLGYFETSLLFQSWTIPDDFSVGDCSDTFANKERDTCTSLDKSNSSDVDNVLSPRHLFWKSSNVNKLVLSMMSSDDDSKNDPNVSGSLISDLQNAHSLNSFERDQVIDIKNKHTESNKSSDICKENLTLADLQQSFCRKTNTNNSCVWTSIRVKSSIDDSYHGGLASKGIFSPEDVYEKLGHLKPVWFSTTDTEDFSSESGIQLDELKTNHISCDEVNEKVTCANDGSTERVQCKGTCFDSSLIMVHTPNLNAANNEFEWMFDSPNSEDIDVFLAQVSLSWLSAKPKLIDPKLNEQGYEDGKRCLGDAEESNSTSDFNIDYASHVPATCLTSTPSLTNRSNDQVCDLEGFINSTFSPIYSEVSTPSERERLSKDIASNTCNYVETHDMFALAPKRQSKLDSSSTPISTLKGISNRLCSAMPLKTNNQQSLCEASSKNRREQKSKSLLRCILTTKRPSRSRNSSLKKAAQSPKKSPVSSDIPLVRRSTLKTWAGNSLLLFEDESDVNGSTEGSSRRKFEEIRDNPTPVNPVPVCTDSNVDGPSSSHSNGDMIFLNNKVDEQLTSTCSSPLLFSQP